MIKKNDFEFQLNKMGWQVGDPSFWDYYYAKQPQIAIIAPPLDTIPSKTGNAIYVLVEKLAQHICEPVIVLSKWNTGVDCSKSPIINKIIYKQNSKIDPLIGGILPYKLKKKLWGSSITNVIQYFQLAGRVCDQLNIKVAIIEDVTQGVLGFKKLGSSMHLILHQHQISPLGLSEKKWKQTLEQLDEIVFVSQKTLNQVEHKFGPIPIRTEVIYNGVDLSWFDPNRWESEAIRIKKNLNMPTNSRVLLYVGRLLPQKGVLEAIKAFKLANIPDVSFVIVGDTSASFLTSDINYVAVLKNEVANMENRIFLAGSVSQEEIPAWYQMADVLVVPSIGEEGLPKVITEALAMGCPVIATDRGGNWELIRNEENGWFLEDPNNIEGFSNLLKNVFSSEEQLKKKMKLFFDVNRSNMDEQKMVMEFTKMIHRAARIQEED